MTSNFLDDQNDVVADVAEAAARIVANSVNRQADLFLKKHGLKLDVDDIKAKGYVFVMENDGYGEHKFTLAKIVEEKKIKVNVSYNIKK